MPQLDFSNPLTLSQVVWMAIIFGLLYYILARYALPQVAGVVEGRAHRIAGDLDSARAAKAQSDAAVAEIAEASRKAAADGQAAISQAVAQAKAEAAEQSRAAEERLNAQLAVAEQRIGEARASAMGALRQVATETASMVVTRLTGQQADAASVDAAISHVMSAHG